MKEKISLESPGMRVRLSAIQESDCEKLMQWKNEHRLAFFFQGIITPEQQIQWFENYLNRSDDYMFIVFANTESIGCMGFRMIDHRADIYNVILGEANFGGKGLMSQAIRLMCSFIYAEFSREIVAQVLSTNPALEWYLKNGFRDITTRENFVQVALDLARFHPCTFHKLSNVQ